MQRIDRCPSRRDQPPVRFALARQCSMANAMLAVEHPTEYMEEGVSYLLPTFQVPFGFPDQSVGLQSNVTTTHIVHAESPPGREEGCIATTLFDRILCISYSYFRAYLHGKRVSFSTFGKDQSASTRAPLLLLLHIFHSSARHYLIRA